MDNMEVNDRRKSSGPGFGPVRASNQRQHPRNKNNGTTVNCIADDCGDHSSEPRAIPASRTSTAEDSTMNVEPSCKQRQTESSFQSGKRTFEVLAEDVGNQGAKRSKASPDSPSLQMHSPNNNQDSGTIVTYCSGQMAAVQTLQGIRSHQNHSLQDYQMQIALLEQQNKKRLMMARQLLDEPDSTVGCTPQEGQGSATTDGANGTHQATGINTNIGSQLFSNIVHATAVPLMQPESTGPSQRTSPAVARDDAYEHTPSQLASNPTIPESDAPRTQDPRDFPVVTQPPRHRSVPESELTEINQSTTSPRYDPKNSQLQQPHPGAPQETDVQSRSSSFTMSPETGRPNFQPPPQHCLDTAAPCYPQAPYRTPSDLTSLISEH
jgi:hypothetical protein